MKKKSSAQIRRMEKRAAARGEVYTYVPSLNTRRIAIAQRLEQELQSIDKDPNLVSKDRRSAKRKAEAMAAEEAEMTRTEFLEWCENRKKDNPKPRKDHKKEKKNSPKSIEGAKEGQSSDSKPPASQDEDTKYQSAAQKLVSELESIDANSEITAKERRSAKRKARAIAAEESGMDVQKLLDMYQSNPKNAKT